MADQQFEPDESLKVIRSMIDKTREGISDRSKYFLVWGWGALIGSLSQFILKVVFDYPYHYRVWFITFICAFISILMGKHDRKKERVTTYVGESMGFLWRGLGICFFIISIIFVKIGWQYCYPFFMAMYGLGTFVSGKILRNSPFVIGGLLSFGLAAVSVWFPYDYQILFAAAALLVSYIIPAHLFRRKFRRSRYN
ncbi:MAG TPA: hypothetical protein VK498_10315 [Ferruginibacter sp.]|nr:hypothetical protein [Ferruginibacter sp.]